MVEKLVLRQPPDAKPETRSAAEIIRRKIARRAAAEFRDGMNINLGIYIQMELLPEVSNFEIGLNVGLFRLGLRMCLGLGFDLTFGARDRIFKL